MKKHKDAFLVPSLKHKGTVIVAGMGILLAASVIHSHAQQVLSVPNSSIAVNTTNGLLYNWSLNGTEQMNQQTFFYSVGSGNLNSISSISAGTTTAQTSSSLTENYANSTLSVTTGYSLGVQGAGANLSTSISLQNLSGISQTFHFYQYSYFGLGGISSGQNVHFLETTIPYEVMQIGNGAEMTGTISALAGGGLASVEEDAAVWNNGPSGLGLVLGSPAPTFNDTSLSASGNVNFGYEIDATLAPNASLTISELQAVPEPSSVALVSAGILGLGVLRRRGMRIFKK